MKRCFRTTRKILKKCFQFTDNYNRVWIMDKWIYGNCQNLLPHFPLSLNHGVHWYCDRKLFYIMFNENIIYFLKEAIFNISIFINLNRKFASIFCSSNTLCHWNITLLQICRFSMWRRLLISYKYGMVLLSLP